MMKNYMKLFTSLFLCALVSANSLMATNEPQAKKQRRKARSEFLAKNKHAEQQRRAAQIASIKKQSKEYITSGLYALQYLGGVSIIPATYWLLNWGIKRDMLSVQDVRNVLLVTAFNAGAIATVQALKIYDKHATWDRYYSLVESGSDSFGCGGRPSGYHAEKEKTAYKDLCRCATIAALSGIAASVCLIMRTQFNAAA